MVSKEVVKHLHEELSKADPWRLAENPYEQKRYEITIQMLEEVSTPFKNALEIGCGSGILSSHLTGFCEHLYIMDIMPEAIELTRQKLQPAENLHYGVADIAEGIPFHLKFDLIVISEVLYYLESPVFIKKAVDNITSHLNQGGILIFGSVLDVIAEGWGTYGAETAMKLFQEETEELERIYCTGALPDEKSYIVKYAKL